MTLKANLFWSFGAVMLVTSLFSTFIGVRLIGNGMGLSIRYDIVHRHDGPLTVASRVGAGSTFVVTLPVA